MCLLSDAVLSQVLDDRLFFAREKRRSSQHTRSSIVNLCDSDSFLSFSGSLASPGRIPGGESSKRERRRKKTHRESRWIHAVLDHRHAERELLAVEVGVLVRSVDGMLVSAALPRVDLSSASFSPCVKIGEKAEGGEDIPVTRQSRAECQ